ncbi:FapA family protein [Pseudomonas sp. LS44]|uniref:FapA family protein n=1 Tax=Pseudomonas sp. LS44 TaxID=1357074 RepID=UPI00215B5F32|nr:FapA family protein [Pseudomonas sp. LS44]UVE17293.1 FapA family protein [Pseudomonas sp. LS44]
MHRMIRYPRRMPGRQRGMATILIVVLVGMALTVTALGVVHAVRGTQEKQAAMHASTHAQAGAWAGLEIFRSYLEQLDETALGALLANNQIDMQVGTSTLQAKIVSNLPPASGATEKRYTVTANIRNQDNAARATSTIQAVFAVVAGANAAKPHEPWTDVLNIYSDLNMTGGIDVKGGNAAKFNVDGNATLNNASITGIKTLRATGDINIGSAIAVEELFANGNIALGGSATALKASAVGNVNINSGGTQGAIFANGDILISNGSVGTANALGAINASSGGSHGTFTAGKTINISNGTTATANAVGNITASGFPIIRAMNSQADVFCASVNWNNFNSIRAGRATFNCPVAPAKISAPTAVTVLLMTPLQPFSLPKPNVDAYELKDSANYVFEFRNGQIQVGVKNVNGIADGSYRIGRIKQGGDKWGYLCAALDGGGFCRDECSTVVSGTCTGPGMATLRRLTRGNSENAQSITFNNGTWRLEGNSPADTTPPQGTPNEAVVVAPGALWFEGNVELSNGKFRNSILATGNIASSSHRTFAINFAGYANICTSTFYAPLFPTNFCDTAAQQLKPNALGNIALLAGGFVGNTFSGGNINLGASSKIYGSVIAGNLLQTGGDTMINGQVTAASQGGAGSNNWSGRTTIDLRNLPSGYDPGDIPDMGGGTQPCQTDCDPSADSPSGQISQAKLLWSRYL